MQNTVSNLSQKKGNAHCLIMVDENRKGKKKRTPKHGRGNRPCKFLIQFLRIADLLFLFLLGLRFGTQNSNVLSMLA